MLPLEGIQNRLNRPQTGAPSRIHVRSRNKWHLFLNNMPLASNNMPLTNNNGSPAKLCVWGINKNPENPFAWFEALTEPLCQVLR